MRGNGSYSQILGLLTDLVDKKISGTMFVRSECNHAITIALKNGRIHAIFFGARRGYKAISLISDISGGSYRFEISNIVEAFHDLPPTFEILNLLRKPYASSESEPTVSSSAADNEVASEERENMIRQALKGLLGEYMGPIAEMILDDTVEEVGDFCSTPQLTQDLINKLSEEIDNATEVKQFKSKAYVVINNILKN